MLARKLRIVGKDGIEIGRTPMLIPSISSRLNVDILDLLSSFTLLVQGGPLLISAYDLEYYKDIEITSPSFVILDSGGYECNKDKTIAEIEYFNYDLKEAWTREMHSDAILNWKNSIPTVAVSYDHPDIRISFIDQIQEAEELFKKRGDFLREILIKPETPTSLYIKEKNIIENIHLLKSFDIIGFTEKELGSSILERMKKIAFIRRALDSASIIVPIHIFGSLDTVTSPLYFLAGADMFDGLTWLRFIYDGGDTLYKESHGPVLFGANEGERLLGIQTIIHNMRYLKNLELAMSKIATKFKENKSISSEDFNLLGPKGEFFKRTYDDFKEKVGGE